MSRATPSAEAMRQFRVALRACLGLDPIPGDGEDRPPTATSGLKTYADPGSPYDGRGMRRGSLFGGSSR